MENVVLVIHLFLALAIIGLVLLQRSEGGGLGIGGGGGGMGRLATAKGTANFLTRATGICAGAFFLTSLILAVLAGHSSQARHGILEGVAADAPVTQEMPLMPMPADSAIPPAADQLTPVVPPPAEAPAEAPTAPVSQ
jgi:preprotein translocase subunit SecG